MRFLLPTLLVCSAPLWAQSAAPSPYETQKIALGAPRFATLDEVRAGAPRFLGKTIEVGGQVKGVFGREDGFTALLELPDNQTLLIEAPPALRDGPLGRIGARVRVLARVDAAGQTPTLSAQFATEALDEAPGGPVNFSVANGAAQPAEVLTNSSADFGPTRPRPAQPLAPRPLPRPNLSSRAMPRSGIVNRGSSRSNPAPSNRYFGFAPSNRAAYRDLARRHNPRLSPEMADYIAASILSAAQANDLDPRFLASVVQVESAFNPYAVSGAGARGLGQLMPFNLRPLGVGNAFDPMQNLHGAARMLRQNLNTYAGQRDATLLAVAAYHAGVGAVRRAGYRIPKLSTHKYAWKVYYAYRALAPELFR